MPGITLDNPGDRNKDRMTKEATIKLVERWSKELSKGDFVEKLDLQCLVYEPNGAKVICEFLEDKVANVRIALLNDIIATLETSDGLDVLEKFNNLLKNSPLEEVNLDDNALGTRGVIKCADILSRPSLTKISLQNVGLPAESMLDLKLALTKETNDVCVCDRLKEAWFYNNMSGEGGAKEQAQIISRCRALTFWKYVGCRPGERGTKYLAQGLLEMTKYWNGLNQIQLEGTLGSNDDEPLAIFCKALKKLPHLNHLSLYDCSLEHSGTKKILKSLSHIRCQMESLCLSQNEIAAATMKTLVPFILQNTSKLKVLNLENNELTSVGLEILLEGFRDAQDEVVLQQLLLSDNKIGSRGAKALLASKQSLLHLQKLTLDENGIPDDLVIELQDLYGNVFVSFSDEYEYEYDLDEDIEQEADDFDESSVESNDDSNPIVVSDANNVFGIEDIVQGLGNVKLTPDDVSL
jgi:Ran GTPase-activating protein (RanGAP) involved in mRNA processing and transport